MSYPGMAFVTLLSDPHVHATDSDYGIALVVPV